MIELNKEYCLPMQMFIAYHSEDEGKWLCVKDYHEIEPEIIEIGKRMIMPVGIFED